MTMEIAGHIRGTREMLVRVTFSENHDLAVGGELVGALGGGWPSLDLGLTGEVELLEEVAGATAC
ncbi:MAG TPA: hypothetical protein VMR52_06005 [Dehalococcoidia bacterium]|nr:hypothetical protein [Dehalococcoidia bacterium]